MKSEAFTAEAADRRACPRVLVALPAFLEADSERHSVQILDLSVGGAKLDGPAGCLAGSAVVLHCGTLRRAGIVRWCAGRAIGICFDGQLDPSEVAGLVDRSNALEAWRGARRR